LFGLEADGRPIAELWFGAHPDDPSPAPDHDASLDELIAADPVRMLGGDALDRFGPRLPFLVKILAAETALSIQVHPTREQARAGFADEDARGIPRDAPDRNYRDDNHKPELICALTPFEALCGFRPVEQTVAHLDALAIPQLARMRDLLCGPDGLRAAFVHLLEHPDPRAVVEALSARAGESDDPSLHVVRLLAHDFPGDIGIALSLLLNYVRLEPGEALFLAAGNVHCYLRGTGVEVMANSDNVLRCALTSKHVDIPQVVAVTDFSSLAEPRCATAADEFGATYLTDVDDFRLRTVDVEAGGRSFAAEVPAPNLVLCTDGAATVSRLGDEIELAPGQAGFVPAGDGSAFRISGTGRVFWTTTGPAARR
jgi:mannose-6-phosphate isomerase